MLVNPPNNVDRLSAASRNSVVEMALSLEASTGTSTKLFLTVSKKVPPGGYAAAIVIEVCSSVVFVRTDCRKGELKQEIRNQEHVLLWWLQAVWFNTRCS
jgi:hypothetical protein